MAPRTKTAGTAVAKWDEELARLAEINANMEKSSVGGQFFGLRGGQLTFGDSPLPNNEMAVIIIDSVLENVYYEDDYDPDNPASPTCFAFGRDEKTMAPHLIVTDAGQSQHDQCDGCPMNEFGSAERGRGKACRNARRLALIPAGTLARNGELDFIDDPDHYKTADVAYLKVPPTSIRGYASFVQQVTSVLRRPTFAVITKVKVVPDPKNQFKVTFEVIDKVPDALISTLIERNKEIQAVIDFPYQLSDPEAEKPKGRGAAKPAAKAAGKTTKAAAAAKPAAGRRRY